MEDPKLQTIPNVLIKLAELLGGYSGQNDQSSPDEIDHPHKTEPKLVFSSLIAVTNL
jgi:hypothetical protein